MSLERYFLKPGELMITEVPTIVTTVLGSCLAITMFSERCSVGGICHAMLPKGSSARPTEKFRYVDTSILHMVRLFETLGVRKGEIETKVLGGADVLDRADGSSASVGQQNILAALKTIKRVGLTIAASDLGGNLGRKIHFYTHRGLVLMKRIDRRKVEIPDRTSTNAHALLDATAKGLPLAFVRVGTSDARGERGKRTGDEPQR